MNRIRRSSRWIFASIAALLLLLFLTHRIWLAALGGFLVRAENPVPADMVVVLAGDYIGNRIVIGAGLVRQGLAPKVLVSGPADFYGLHESDLAIPFAVRAGYPASYFVPFPHTALSTAAEADVVIPELRKMHAHRVDLVTSNFHTRRAGNIFRKRAPDLEFHVIAAPDRYFTPDAWWKNREGRKTFVIEWMKTIATWLGL